jgi:hypothetical protein
MNMVKVGADQTYFHAECRVLLGAVPGEGAIDAPLPDSITVGLVLALAHRENATNENNPIYVRRLCAALWGLNGDIHWQSYRRYRQPINFLLRVMSLLDMERADNGLACNYNCRRYFHGHRIHEKGANIQYLCSVLDQAYWQRGTWYNIPFKELMKFSKAGLVRKVKLAEAEAAIEALSCHLPEPYSINPAAGFLALPTMHCSTSRGGTREVEYADCMAWAQLTTTIKMLPQFAHQLLSSDNIRELRDSYAKLHAQRVRYALWAFAQPKDFQGCMDEWDAIVLRRIRQTGFSSNSGISASPPWWNDSLDTMNGSLQVSKKQLEFTSGCLR